MSDERGYKIAVIGDPEFTLGFRLAGIRDILDVEDERAVEAAVRNVLGNTDVGIVVIPHDLFIKLPAGIKREIEERVEPTFVKVGGEMGIEELKEKIRRAIGVDLWK
jgi:V/A-type H+-transporting ATPase subunit F